MSSLVQEQNAVHTADTDYLVFSVKDHLIALPYHCIVQIVDSPSWTALPNMPPYVKGVIEFMGGAIPLIDTRVICSLPPLQREVADFIETFMHKKQDHLNWIATLIDCIDHDKEISVERDPHRCAFGKWYDTFKPNTLALAAYTKRFNGPHQAIHNLASQAEALVRQGQKNRAKQLIHEAERNDLARLVVLFDGFEEQIKLSYQEYAIVVSHRGSQYAFSVDSIKYFEKMDELVRDVALMGNISEKLIWGIGRKEVQGRTDDIIIFNLDNIFDTDDVLV